MNFQRLTDNMTVLGRNFNKRLSCMVLLLCTSQFNFGFDVAAFNNIQAMPAFIEQFGVVDPKTGRRVLETYWLSLFGSLQTVGLMVGVLVGSWVSKKFGRRWCVFSMSLSALVWATINISSESKWQILCGRTLNYIFMGMDLSVIPVLQAEICPPAVRGFTVGTYQVIVSLAQVVASGISRGTGSIPSNAAWRIPLGIFYIAPSIVASCIWLVPESPRWLAMQERKEEALSSLQVLRRGKYFTEEDINVEFAEICESVAAGREVERADWREIWRPGANLKRTMIVISANCFLVGTGTNFANSYGAYFIAQMEYVNPFTVTLASNIGVTVLGALVMLMLDRVGRRWFPIIGAALQIIALFTMAALGTVHDPPNSVKAGIISMMQLCLVGYAAGWAPVVHLTSVEVPNNKLRDTTYRTANIIQVLIQFISGFVLPYLLWDPYANLQSRVGFIFGVIAVAALLFSIFCVPELKGLPLEIVDRLFNENVPFRKFQEVGRQWMVVDREELKDEDVFAKGEGGEEALAKGPDVRHVEVSTATGRGRARRGDEEYTPAAEHGTMNIT